MLLLLPVSSCSVLVLRLTLPWVEAGGGRVGRAGHATVAAVTASSVVAVVIITVVVIFAAVGAPHFVLIFLAVVVRGVLSALATRLRRGSCSRRTSVRIY